MQQTTPMKYSPINGQSYLSMDSYYAHNFRQDHPGVVWIHNPWTGRKRFKDDINSDFFGMDIIELDGIWTQGPVKLQLPDPDPEDAPTGIDATLAERGNRYGVFSEHARITQNLKRAMADSPNWAKLSDDKKESLEMLAHKIGRILNGDPEYHDSWHDILGYTKLVADTLQP